MNISIDAGKNKNKNKKKTVDKIQHPFMIKNSPERWA